MFWKVAGFSQPSPVEHILDKCTPGADRVQILEDLLDEDDLIQECKSMNGRLIAFMRERSTVEQLLRYMVEPTDSEDPKRTYKFPFTSCEVFCCEMEAVFNTLIDDGELMKLLFSLLSQPAPLSSKVSGYFGRVVINLLLRKGHELTTFLQSSPELLQQLVSHVETPSICDILKHLVGADEQSNMLLASTYMEWLSASALIELLLSQLSGGSSPDAQANAADVLSAIAHTQPSPLAAKLTHTDSISALFAHALAPSQPQLLVPTLDVCIALIEPRNCRVPGLSEEEQLDIDLDNTRVVREAAVVAIVQHLSSLVDVLKEGVDAEASQETTCGLMPPRMGRHRLKIIELVGVLVRSGSVPALIGVMASGAIDLCLKLFVAHPFSNQLHHYVDAILLDVLTQESHVLLRYLFEKCKLLQWLVTLPAMISPAPNPSQQDAPTPKAPIRAGYMGHATHIGSVLETLADQGKLNLKDHGAVAVIHAVESVHAGSIYEYTEKFEGWTAYLEKVLRPRLDVENTTNWACGRPVNDAPGMDSDGDDFQDMTLEQMHEAMGMGQGGPLSPYSELNMYGAADDDDAAAAAANADDGAHDVGTATAAAADSVGVDEMASALAMLSMGGVTPNDWEDRAGEEGQGEEVEDWLKQ